MRLDTLQTDWPALSRLLDAALALAPTDRPGWLAALPEADAALRGPLQRLLAVQDGLESGDFLRALPTLGPARPAPGAGDLVGPYRLRRRLGSGGMATVWLAERADGGLQRPVALKLPHGNWDGGFAARIARERDILAALEHPHIARLYDAGVDALGRPWLALEVVDGQPIDRHCEERALDLRARLRLLLQAASAVAYAHSRQVVHRDLKPSNLLVGADGRVRLLDFGIARLLQGGPDVALTQAGTRVLTPAYASPEQVRGEPAGPASDVYSLGVIAYELLAGTRPYGLARDAGAAAVEAAVIGARIVAPSAACNDRVRARALRGDLDAVIGRALRHDLAERTSGAEAFAADLRRYLDGEPVQARAETWRDRLRRTWRRRRPVIVATALAAAGAALVIGLGPVALALGALAAGLALVAWQARLARAQAARAHDQARRADAVQQFLAGMLASAGIGAGDAATRAELTLGQWLDQAAQRLQDEPAPDAAVQEALLDIVGRLLHGLGRPARAATLRLDLALRLDARGAPALERARAHRACGESLAQAEQHDAAAAAFADASARLVPGPAAETEQALLAARLGRVRLIQGRVTEAAAAIEPAAAALPRDAAPALRADLCGALAMLRDQQGRVDDARRLYHEAITADAADPLRPEAIERRHEMAKMLISHGRHADGETELRAALAAVSAAGGVQHPAAVWLQVELARLLGIVGRTDEALRRLQAAADAVALAPASFPPLTHPRLRVRRAEVLLDDGRVDEAGPELAGAADLLCAAPGLEATVTMLLRARWLTETGNFDEALRWIDRACAMRLAAVGAGHAYARSAQNRAVVTLIAARRFDEAEAALTPLLDGPEATAAETFGSPRDLALANRVTLLLETGRGAAALAPAQALLDRLLALPAPARTRSAEIALRLRLARALLPHRDRQADVDAQIAALEALVEPLYAHAPARLLVATLEARRWAGAGEPARAAAALARARAHLAAQPGLGPQYRRAIEQDCTPPV